MKLDSHENTIIRAKQAWWSRKGHVEIHKVASFFNLSVKELSRSIRDDLSELAEVVIEDTTPFVVVEFDAFEVRPYYINRVVLGHELDLYYYMKYPDRHKDFDLYIDPEFA